MALAKVPAAFVPAVSMCVRGLTLCVCEAEDEEVRRSVTNTCVCPTVSKNMKNENGACVPFPMEPSEPLIKGPTDDDRCRDDLCHAEHCLIGSDRGAALAAVARLRHVPMVGFHPTVNANQAHRERLKQPPGEAQTAGAGARGLERRRPNQPAW